MKRKLTSGHFFMLTISPALYISHALGFVIGLLYQFYMSGFILSEQFVDKLFPPKIGEPK